MLPWATIGLRRINKSIHETRRVQGGGYLYVLINPAWPQYCKIGRTTDLQSRLRAYQTGDPTRSYVLYYVRYFSDICLAERTLAGLYGGSKTRHEWYFIHAEDAANIIDRVANQLGE